MIGRTTILGIATLALVAGIPAYSTALPIAPPNAAQVDQISNVIDVKNHNRGGKSAAKAKPRAAKAHKASTAKRHVNKRNVTTRHVNKRTVVKRNVTVHRTVVVRPHRVWVRRPYYGTIIAGVALGTIIVATAPRVVPVAPAPNVCWYWSDPDMIHGYWDYCV